MNRVGIHVARAYLVLAAAMFLFGGVLALGMRWKLAWPASPVPVLSAMHDWPGGVMPLDTYARTFTLHGTVMIWLVVVPALTWGLGLAALPKLCGTTLRLPALAWLGLWVTLAGAAVLLVGWAGAGWTAYPPLSTGPVLADRWVPYTADVASWLRMSGDDAGLRVQSRWSPAALYASLVTFAGCGWTLVAKPWWAKGIAAVVAGVGGVAAAQRVAFDGQTAWFLAVATFATAGCLTATSLLTTVAARTRTPRAVSLVGWSAAAAVGLLAGPVIIVAMAMNLLDANRVTGFFDPARGGQPLLHQHLFWFYGHPLVYLMILPAYGVVSDTLARRAGRHVGYAAAVVSVVAVAVLGFGVWAHHMYQSGLDPGGALVFSATSMLVGIPSAVLVVTWVAMLAGNVRRMTPATWAAVAFVSLFVVGGLSGVVLAAPAANVQLHDTYFVVAHLHYTLFGGSVFGLFAALYHLWPRLTGGRRLGRTLGVWHVALTYIAFNGTFGLMHLLGVLGMPRRYAEPTRIDIFAHLAWAQQAMTVSAMVLGAAQLLFVANVAWSLISKRDTRRPRGMWPYAATARHASGNAVNSSNAMTHPDPHDRRRTGGPVFWWALATVLAMFPLIWMGGLVTSKGVGMAVPDWPNTFGYNMWAVPWSHWVGSDAGGVFHEHFHRLLGTVAGFCAVGTVLAAYGASHTSAARRRWGTAAAGGLGVLAFGYVFLKFFSPFGYGVDKNLWHVVSFGGALALTAGVGWLVRNPPDPRTWVRRLTAGLLAAVCVQGLLGGLRVVLDSTDLAMIHGVFAQLTLCVGGVAVLATSAWWKHVRPVRRPHVAWPAVALLGLCVAHLVIAAAMRHGGAGLAVPDFPLHYGQLLPPTHADGLAAANDLRRFELFLPAVTLTQVWLHVTHRLGAYFITLVTLWVVWRLWHVARLHVLVVAALVGVQVVLGVLTVLLGKPADVATLHVATGATLLLAAALLATRLVRQYGLVPARATAPVPSAAAATHNPVLT